jgi:hypothetical protein
MTFRFARPNVLHRAAVAAVFVTAAVLTLIVFAKIGPIVFGLPAPFFRRVAARAVAA